MSKKFKKSLFVLVSFLTSSFILSGCASDFYTNFENQVVQKVVSVEVLDQETAKADTIEYETLTKVQEGINYYLYNGLKDEQKKLYDEIYDSLVKMKGEVIVSTIDEAELKQTFEYVMMDHPEIFFADGYQFTRYYSGEELTKIGFVGNFNMTEEEVLECWDKINLEVEDIMTQVSQYQDEYEKAKYIYDYLIKNTDYELDCPDSQNICSVLINRISVCQGYAKAYQFLMQKNGMEATLVSGETNSDGHAWDLVKVDGEYYYVDPTWGDASYILDENISDEYKNMDFSDGVNYDYFLVTTEDIMKTHTFDSGDIYPECVSKNDNYYVKENLYLEEWNFDIASEMINSAYMANKDGMTLKCRDTATLEELKQELIEEQRIFETLNLSSGGIAYAFDEDQLTFTIWF